MRNSQHITVRVPIGDVEALQERAKAAGTSLAAVIRERLTADRPLDLAPVQALIVTAARRAVAGQLTDGEREALAGLARAVAVVRQSQGAGAAIEELLAASAGR